MAKTRGTTFKTPPHPPSSRQSTPISPPNNNFGINQGTLDGNEEDASASPACSQSGISRLLCTTSSLLPQATKVPLLKVLLSPDHHLNFSKLCNLNYNLYCTPGSIFASKCRIDKTFWSICKKKNQHHFLHFYCNAAYSRSIITTTTTTTTTTSPSSSSSSSSGSSKQKSKEIKGNQQEKPPHTSATMVSHSSMLPGTYRKLFLFILFNYYIVLSHFSPSL
jgi:hypothetical protein